MLALDAQLTPVGRAYATLATVSAQLARGEREAAAEVLAAQRGALPAGEMDKPWFRYLRLVLTAPAARGALIAFRTAAPAA